jgi:hypothetical protein
VDETFVLIVQGEILQGFIVDPKMRLYVFTLFYKYFLHEQKEKNEGIACLK